MNTGKMRLRGVLGSAYTRILDSKVGLMNRVEMDTGGARPVWDAETEARLKGLSERDRKLLGRVFEQWSLLLQAGASLEELRLAGRAMLLEAANQGSRPEKN